MRKSILTVAGLCLLVSVAQGLDYWGGPPGWQRGEPGSTYQKFDMSTPLVGGVDPADLDENDFGEPTIERVGIWEWAVVEGPGGEGTVDAWHCADPEGGKLVLRIPNDPQNNPLKKIYLQVTSTKSIPSISAMGGTSSGSGGFTSGTFPTGRGPIQLGGGVAGSGPWYTYSYGLTIEPNPEFETVTLDVLECTWIDQIDVDTICTVPEPATLSVLGLGGLGLLRRRRR